MGKKKKQVFVYVNIILLCLSVITVFLIFELILRLFFPIYNPSFKPLTSRQQQPLTEIDKDLGWLNKKCVTAYLDSSEFKTQVSLNSSRMRGENYGYKKEAGAKRVLIIGDSFIFGYGVDDDEILSEVLNRLFESSGKRVEVLGMGVDGYGNVQELLWLKKEGIRYHPDIVICQFFVGNDLINNTSWREYGLTRPYSVIDDQGKVVIKDNPAHSSLNDEKKFKGIVNQGQPAPHFRLKIPFKDFLTSKSYVYIFLRLRYNNLMYKLGLRGGYEIGDSPRNVEIAEEIFLKMNRLCKSQGAKLIILLVPTGEQRLGVMDDHLQKSLSAFLNNNGIETIDLLPLLRGKNGLYYTIDSHWNPNGHRFVARIIYDRIKGRL
jgi:hypothetical protein